MKEFDFKTVQTLIKSELEVFNAKYIAIFLLINILVVFANWLIQKNLKNQENKIYRKKLREDRKITLLEDIYKDLVSLTYIFDANEMNLQIFKIAEIEKKLAENKLYVGSTMTQKITSFLDYTKNIAADFRKKNFNEEKKLLDAFEKEFNK